MKTPALFFISFFLAASFASAQENYGTIKITTKLRPDGSKSTTKLDPDNHTAEETITNAANKLMSKTVYLLGDKDIAVGAIFYDAKDNVVYKAAYTRDPAGHVTEAAFSAPDGRYLGKRVFIYSGATGDTATQVIDYDANGLQIVAAQPVSPKSGKKKR